MFCYCLLIHIICIRRKHSDVDLTPASSLTRQPKSQDSVPHSKNPKINQGGTGGNVIGKNIVTERGQLPLESALIK